ncbi:MAG TPA: endonuclease/exonuclease/phosphatase family protein [Clostridia bacterium]|nr:endonuclease/exonuclease/phosphatase family protein [Clostridia bacterium]
MKKALKVLAVLLALVLLVVGIYVAYVFISYYRIEDNVKLSVDGGAGEVMSLDTSYTMTTYNIGFGAYSPDFTFFMDGGTESRAKSKESCTKLVNGAADTIAALHADIMLFQEVDLKATRSHHLDQYKMLRDKFSDVDSVKGINYDSAYLFYPLTKPHGKSLASIVTMSDFRIIDSVRRSLPISTSLSKLVDLDRCYTVSQIETQGDKNLFVYNIHMSAYGGDPQIRADQVKMLFDDMSEKIKQGNYVICGGDFNHDLPGNSAELLNGEGQAEFSWAKPFPVELMPKEITMCLDYANDELVPTARNCDIPYVKGETFVIIIDGFFVSPGVEVVKVENVDTGFEFSDHNPVLLEFKLK